MSEVYAMSGGFDALLSGVLRARRDAAEAPAGMEQRLRARLAQAETSMEAPAQVFGFAEAVKGRRSAASVWSAVLLHGALLAVLLLAVRAGVGVKAPEKTVVDALTLPTPQVVVRMEHAGHGGGGQHDIAAASEGRPPKPAPEPLLPPKAPVDEAKLQVEPTVNTQDLQMSQNAPNLGVPSSTVHGFSLGTGHGTGIGNGAGDGLGDGTGGNFGDGLMHPGGAISKPDLIYAPDPEFSEEARRAKFSGDVQVYLWVDEHGNPSHVRVVRGIGMGLDEKAVEAVRQYKFKPAMLHGKPVKVDMYVDVDFRIF